MPVDKVDQPAARIQAMADTEKDPSAKLVEPENSPGEEESGEPPLPQPNPSELPWVLEALLFATTAPLNLKRLQTLTGGVDAEDIRVALEFLQDRHQDGRSGVMLMEVAGGYQLATRSEFADWVLALHKHRRKNLLSPAVMETLSIVAYKQPLVRAEIESIRGVDCGGVLRSLQDAGLVEVVGHKEVPGRPSLYGTTETFLKTFGLRELSELPALSDLQRILNAPMKAPEEEPADPERQKEAGEAGEEGIEEETGEAGEAGDAFSQET